MRYPKDVIKLNSRLRSDLGANPLYNWRWSDDLLHVMDVVDEDGSPKYVETITPAGVICLTPATLTRPLLPYNEHCWALCALLELNNKDGELQGTGNHGWVPVSGGDGPVALFPFEKPNLETTVYVIGAIHSERVKTATQKGEEWDAEMARSEKAKWNLAYDQIRDAATAFYSIPGEKHHVSFPS